MSTLALKLIGASTNDMLIGLNDTDTSMCIEETNTTSPFSNLSFLDQHTNIRALNEFL